ncbi:MAG: TolC family protein (plasmid) [Candidatus Manganitrophus sp.]|nr:MAG: TolC family protein [Candidatus Manganitrophus sp.]
MVEFPPNSNIGNANETWYTLSQNFPFFGKRELRGNVAGLMESRMAAEEFRAQWSLKVIMAQAKQAYYDLFFAHKALDIHHGQVELARTFSQIAREKLAVGEAGQQDLLRAQVELLNLSNAHFSLPWSRKGRRRRRDSISS